MNIEFKNSQIKNLLKEYKTIWSLDYATSLIDWDLNTYLPKGASENHGAALGKFEVLRQEKLLSKKFLDLVNKCTKEKTLNETEKALLRNINRQIEKYKKLPAKFIEEYANTTTNSQNAWEKAKIENNYKLFEPHLAKIIELSLRKAEYLGYKNHPLDALLDEFEEGSTEKQVYEYFEGIKPVILELLTYIKNSKKYTKKHPLEDAPYNKLKAEIINQNILKLFDISQDNLRIDVSTHPFTVGFSSKQARITTWYHSSNINRTIAATAHEFGHALYDLNSSPSLDYSPLSGGSSLGIHESQSRFWENMVGRNENFIQLLISDINKALDKKVSAEDYYKYANTVRPSLIRVEADEVTYHMHILIRFEMEKGFLEKTIKPKDAPDIWNEKYQNYLGVKPNNYSDGILQDIHWSMGAIGYFPTYSTGTVLSATWKELLEKDLGSLDSLVKSKQGIHKIKNWQKEHIHKYGSIYTFNELIKMQTGKAFITKPWEEYLNNKYKAIY